MNTKIVEGVMPAQAEKQEPCDCKAPSACRVFGTCQYPKPEPVKDEPVAWCQDTENEITPEFGFSWVKTRLHDVPLYTRPQPEPVKDEPVARVDANDDGYWADILPDRSVKVGQLLYTRPQDLTAEVERLKAERDSFCMNYRMKCDLETKQQAERIAELEEAAREAREALQYHTFQTRPIFNTTDAIAKLDVVLGNAEITGG